MARVNRKGLQGSTYRRLKNGELTSETDNIFVHITKISKSYDQENVIIKFKIWESKSDYKNGKSQSTILGDVRKQYLIDSNVKVQKGKDVYDGDDSTTTFAFTKSNDGQDYLKVVVGGQLMTFGVDYTIAYDSGDSGTGSVTFTSAPATGDKVKLFRLKQAYALFFKPAKTTAEGEDDFTRAVEFLQTLDGTDPWDDIKIDFESFTVDEAA